MPRPLSSTSNTANLPSDPTANPYHARAAWLEVFEGVIQQIAEDLLDREPVALHVQQRSDRKHRLLLGGAMRDAARDRVQQFAHIDFLGVEFTSAFTRQPKHRVDEPVHLGDRAFDEAERFFKFLAQSFDPCAGLGCCPSQWLCA